MIILKLQLINRMQICPFQFYSSECGGRKGSDAKFDTEWRRKRPEGCGRINFGVSQCGHVFSHTSRTESVLVCESVGTVSGAIGSNWFRQRDAVRRGHGGQSGDQCASWQQSTGSWPKSTLQHIPRTRGTGTPSVFTLHSTDGRCVCVRSHWKCAEHSAGQAVVVYLRNVRLHRLR